MSSKSILVNTLTFARVPLILVWLVLALVEEYHSTVPLIFFAGTAMFLSGITDAFDGALARKWNVVSPLGKMADPLMDKVFYVVTFPTLTWFALRQGDEPHACVLLVFTILYILRDLWVTFLRSVGTLFGADGAAMWLGKVRTALSFPAAGWIYAYLVLHDAALLAPYDRWLLTGCYCVEAFMIVLNVVSCITYTRCYLPYLKKALEHR